jgi:predicted TIM-barrel fold metal-dependent hydrolase
MFATDFPHIECEWPDTKPIVEEIYANVPEDEKLKMWAGNTVKFFNLEHAPSKVKAAEVTA